MPASKERLRYIFADGASAVLTGFGWTKEATATECLFTKQVGDYVEVLPFKRIKLYPRLAFDQALHFGGVDPEEFIAAYVAHYKGDPPLAPL